MMMARSRQPSVLGGRRLVTTEPVGNTARFRRACPKPRVSNRGQVTTRAESGFTRTLSNGNGPMTKKSPETLFEFQVLDLHPG